VERRQCSESDSYRRLASSWARDEVYGHWTRLPADKRPSLYLHGMSPGALNSELSFDIHDIIADMFHGALWVGPPFRTDHWNRITARRDPGSPAWLPRFRAARWFAS
jgi:uncharacterized membrane protein